MTEIAVSTNNTEAIIDPRTKAARKRPITMEKARSVNSAAFKTSNFLRGPRWGSSEPSRLWPIVILYVAFISGNTPRLANVRQLRLHLRVTSK
jgi:hypothetical protein